MSARVHQKIKSEEGHPSEYYYDLRWFKLPGSALLKYRKHTRACTKGVLFRTSMYKMYIQETYCY